MIGYIHSIAIVVSDQDKALDFYVNTLGWEKAMDSPMGHGMRWLTVVPPGANTQLALTPPSWYTGDYEGQTPSKYGISLVTADLDATYETLKAKGVKFKNPPEIMPWGAKAAWFYDPDGNEFFVVND